MIRTWRARIRLAAVPVVLALAALLVAACGGDDGNGNGNGNGNGGDGDFRTGSDEEYVTALCESASDLTEDLFAAMGELDPDAEDAEAMEALVEPFQEYAAALADAPVPDDVREHHANLVGAVNDVVSRLEEGDVSVLEDENPIPQPPDEIRERLSSVAEDIEACEGTQLFQEGE